MLCILNYKNIMKEINKWLVFVLFVSLWGCEQHEAQMYEDAARICFARGEDGGGQQDSILQSFFVIPETQMRDTVWVEVALMGFPVNAERPLKIVQVNQDRAMAAVAGLDYVAFDDDEVRGLMVMGANQVVAKVPVILLRNSSLKTEKKRLEMVIEENDFFKRGIDADCNFMIRTTELAEIPENWDAMWKSYFGEWTSRKMWFVVNYLGLNDFEEEYDAGYKKYLKQKAHSKLNEYNRVHAEPLCNDPEKHHENGERCKDCVVFP